MERLIQQIPYSSTNLVVSGLTVTVPVMVPIIVQQRELRTSAVVDLINVEIVQ